MTTKNAQLGDRNSVRGKASTDEQRWGKWERVRVAYLYPKPKRKAKKPTPPKRGKGGRWSTRAGAWGTRLLTFDGKDAPAYAVAKLLNNRGVVLPARRERG